MITEERKKELAKSYEGNIATCLSRKDWDSVRTVLEDLICTVAAEARKGGIDEVIIIIKEAPIQIKHGVKDPIHTTVGPLAELIEEAERLREQG